MTPTVISVSNSSTRVFEDDVKKMTLACGKQLAQHVAPILGLTPAIEYVPKGGKPTYGNCPATIDDTPDVPGALGYHDEDDNAVPYIKVFTISLDSGGEVLTGDQAVSVTLSHEVLELTGDAPANRWVDGPGGMDYAFELCDAVEGDTYEIDGVAVSNFVLPAWFDPKAKAGESFDYLGKLTAPFTMTAGGYMIVRTEPGKVTQVFAHHANRQKDVDVKEAGRGLYLVFGKDFPEHMKAVKIAKALKRRGKTRK
jgi:hypothetical protein